MKVFFVLFLFFINFLSALGKEIINYNGKSLDISRKAFVFRDETGSIKEEDIVKGLYDNKFKLNIDNLFYLREKGTYYIKVAIIILIKIN